MTNGILPKIEKPVYHWSADNMRKSALFGCTFAEFAKERLAGSSPEDIADKTFFEPCVHAIKNDGQAILQASINPVTPFHVLSFPNPNRVGIIRTPEGTLENMPADGGLVDMDLSRAMDAFKILFDWTTQGYKSNPENSERIVPDQSVWTANMGRAAALAVPYLHLHHLAMYSDEGFYNRIDRFRKRDSNTERFIRPHKETPQSVLRSAFEAEYGLDALNALHADTSIPKLELPSLHSEIATVQRENTVKPNDFSVSVNVLNPQEEDSGSCVHWPHIQEIVETAYRIQEEFKKQGAGGFTMLADTTLMHSPHKVIATAGERSTFSMYFATHMDPEKYPQDLPCTKGGYVYAAQKLHALDI